MYYYLIFVARQQIVAEKNDVFKHRGAEIQRAQRSQTYHSGGSIEPMTRTAGQDRMKPLTAGDLETNYHQYS